MYIDSQTNAYPQISIRRLCANTNKVRFAKVSMKNMSFYVLCIRAIFVEPAFVILQQ